MLTSVSGNGYPKNILVDQKGIIRFIFDQIPMDKEQDSYDTAVWKMIMQEMKVPSSGE